jgi:hypothetical protein
MAGMGQSDRGDGRRVLLRRAILSYISHGARRDTTNQFENPDRGTEVAMPLLIAGEIGGFGVILAGFIVGQLF